MFRFTNILLLLFISLSYSLTTYHYPALNLTCIDNQYLTYNNTQAFLILPIFYYAKIQVDLRHIHANATLENVQLSLYINNTDTGASFIENIPLNISVGTFGLQADNNLLISAQFLITDQNQKAAMSKSYLFKESVSVTITKANPQGNAQSSFLFIVTNQDLVSLPYNMIDNNKAKSFNGYFLSQINTMYSMYSRQSTVPSYSDYWYGFQSVSLPYLPYFSNCQDAGNYLYFSQLIHNASQCQLYGDNNSPINQFNFGSSATADTCTISRKCVYDQKPNVNNEYPYWNTLSTTTSALFSITAQEQSENLMGKSFAQNELVSCKIPSDSGSNSSNSFPLKVTLDIGYYQMTNTKRRIIKCQLSYSLFTQSSSNFTYDLQIKFAPLDHTQIMLNFGFDWYIYMLVFMIIGLISNLQFLVFWCYNLMVTVKRAWKFNLLIYFRLYKEIFKGILPAFAITIGITFSVQVIMNGTFFGQPIFATFITFWNSMIVNNVGYFAQSKLTTAQRGRMGLSYIIVSGYLLVIISQLLVGKERKKSQYQDYQVLGRKFKPKMWNKGKFLFGTFLYIFIATSFFYFTYSSLFNLYIWYIIAFMQIMQMVAQQICSSIYEDQLPCIPLKISLGILSYLATMGAIDLYYFILGYLVDVGISLIEITYLNQLQQKLTKFIEDKSEQLNRFIEKAFNDEDEQKEKEDSLEQEHQAKDGIQIQEQLNQINLMEQQVEQYHNIGVLQQLVQYDQQIQIREKFMKFLISSNQQSKDNKNNSKNISQRQKQMNQFQSNKFELIIDCTCNMIQYLMQPIIVLMLWINYQTNNILNNFAISYQNCILYLLSSAVLALFYQFNIIIIFHVLQLYLNFDYIEIITKLLDRASNKKTFWITDQNYIQKDIDLKLRGTYSYSLSSQMFFLVTLYICSMYQFINGIITIIESGYNIFKDPFCILIFFFWIISTKLAIVVVKKVISFVDFWGISSLSQHNYSEKTNVEVLYQHEASSNQFIKTQEASIKFTFKNINNSFPQEQNLQEIQKKKYLQSKLEIICKKLRPQFDKQSFRLQYSRKNKEFIRKNIQKILPFVRQFPQNDTELIGQSGNIRSHQMKNQSKNCDPLVSDFLSGWIKMVETNRSKRQQKGNQYESSIKKCNFCFKTWGIYYGYQGICLQCSQKVLKSLKDKKQD